MQPTAVDLMDTADVSGHPLFVGVFFAFFAFLYLFALFSFQGILKRRYQYVHPSCRHFVTNLLHKQCRLCAPKRATAAALSQRFSFPFLSGPLRIWRRRRSAFARHRPSVNLISLPSFLLCRFVCPFSLFSSPSPSRLLSSPCWLLLLLLSLSLFLSLSLSPASLLFTTASSKDACGQFALARALRGKRCYGGAVGARRTASRRGGALVALPPSARPRVARQCSSAAVRSSLSLSRSLSLFLSLSLSTLLSPSLPPSLLPPSICFWLFSTLAASRQQPLPPSPPPPVLSLLLLFLLFLLLLL